MRNWRVTPACAVSRNRYSIDSCEVLGWAAANPQRTAGIDRGQLPVIVQQSHDRAVRGESHRLVQQ